MAKFAQYCVIYKDEFGGSHEWEKRQEHLGELFKEDSSVEFTIGEGSDRKNYKHRLYHLAANPDIIVMRFANDKDLPIEKDFEQSTTKTEPSCFIILDNRNGMRSMAIQNRREAFSSPSQVAKILSSKLTELLYSKYCYSVNISPDYYPEDLFKLWSICQQNAAAVRFGVPSNLPDDVMSKIEELKKRGKDYFDDSLMQPILTMAYEAKKANYNQSITVTPEEKKTALFVDKTSAYMRNLLSLSAAIDEPVELITTDGASFRCFVDTESENVDKIVNREFDATMLELLFNTKKKDGEDVTVEDRTNIEERIVEFVNGMQHEPKDEKKTA